MQLSARFNKEQQRIVRACQLLEDGKFGVIPIAAST
jgi:hypothetical protein